MNNHERKPEPTKNAGINKVYEEALKKAMIATDGATRQINNLLAARERMRLTIILGGLTEDAIRQAMIASIRSLLIQVGLLVVRTDCGPDVLIKREDVERLLAEFLASVTDPDKAPAPPSQPKE